MAKIFLFLALLGLGLLLTCTATVYTVGDTAGWDISTDLNSWVAGKSFTVGDILGKFHLFLWSFNFFI